MKITIGHLYPDLLNLYGDRGNIQCMKKRLEWRGIEASVMEFSLTATFLISPITEYWSHSIPQGIKQVSTME